VWLLPNGRASDRYAFRPCPGFFCKTPFRRGGVVGFLLDPQKFHLRPERCIHWNRHTLLPIQRKDAAGRRKSSRGVFGCIKSLPLETPPPPGRSAASSRPLRGGGQCMAIAPEAVHVEQERDFGRVFTLAAERGSLPWNCIDGESPPWVGARRGMGRSRRPHENGAGSL
jgi:hypothetical protein